MFYHASAFALRASVILFGLVALCLGHKDLTLKQPGTSSSASGNVNVAVAAVNGQNAARGMLRFLNPKYRLGARDSAQYSRLKPKSPPTHEDPTVQCGDQIMRVVVKLQDVENLQVISGEWQR